MIRGVRILLKYLMTVNFDLLVINNVKRLLSITSG